MPFWNNYPPQAHAEAKFVLISYSNVLRIYLTQRDYDTFVEILQTLYGLNDHNDPESGALRRILRQLVEPHPVLHPGFDVFITHEDPWFHPNFRLLLLQFRLLKVLLTFPLGCRSLVERPVLEQVKFYYLAMSFTAHAHLTLMQEDYVMYLSAWFNFQAGRRWTYTHFRDEIRRFSQDTELLLGCIIFQNLLDSTLPDGGGLRPFLTFRPGLNH